MELKARGNALFRDGDFRGAASAFRRAIEGADQISSPVSDAAEFKVACLCNLAYACIKLGSMDEAEEACCQTLHMRPANAKALFRRGQARLALERPIEAASDFSKVCLLEPSNAEAIKMLRRAQGGEDHRRPPVGISADKSGGERSKAAVPTTPNSEEPLPRGTTRGGSSNKNVMMDVKPEKAQAGSDAEHHNVESSNVYSAPPSGSSFMVSGWLDSAERKQGEQPRGGENRNINIHRHHLDGCTDHDRSPASPRSGVESAVSFSRLVSKLSLAQRGATKKLQEQSVASGTAAPAVQAEWSRLQAEEDIRVQESLRRWSTGGGSHAREKTTPKTDAVKGGKLKEKTAAKKTKSKTVHEGGSKKVNQASEWWASLEEEENRVREVFRAKLGVGEKLSSKVKVKEKNKHRNNNSSKENG